MTPANADVVAKLSGIKLPVNLPSVARLLSANVLLAAASFISSVLLARALDPQARGALANVVLWPMFLSHIGLFGVHVHLSRKAAENPAGIEAYYRQGYLALIVSCVTAVVIYGLLLAVTEISMVSSTGATGALIAILIIPFSAWNAMQVQMELGRKHLDAYNFARGSFSVSYLLLVAGLFALRSRDAIAYLWAFIVAAAFGATSTHWMIGRTLETSKRSGAIDATPIDRETLVRTFCASSPFAFSIALNALTSSADRIAISLFFDAQTMGVYVVALALSQVQGIVNEAIAPLFFTSTARKDHAAQTEPDWLARRLRQSIFINAGICAGLVLVAPILLPFVYGETYRSALSVVALLLPATCARSMMRPFEEVLKGANRPLSQSLAISVNTGVFFTGAAVAGWFNSVVGIAVALLVASMLGLAVVAMLVSRAREIAISRLLMPRLGDLIALADEVRHLLRI